MVWEEHKVFHAEKVRMEMHVQIRLRVGLDEDEDSHREDVIRSQDHSFPRRRRRRCLSSSSSVWVACTLGMDVWRQAERRDCRGGRKFTALIRDGAMQEEIHTVQELKLPERSLPGIQERETTDGEVRLTDDLFPDPELFHRRVLKTQDQFPESCFLLIVQCFQGTEEFLIHPL